MKISLNDLIKIAQQHTETPQDSRDRCDVERFINALNIKEGKHLVKSSVVYKAYKEWSAKPVSSQSFKLRFSQLFNPTGSREKSYMLNIRPIELLNKVDNKKVTIK